jgi:hypothetical protein
MVRKVRTIVFMVMLSSLSDISTSFVKPTLAEIRPKEGEITPYRELVQNKRRITKTKDKTKESKTKTKKQQNNEHYCSNFSYHVLHI